MKKLLDFILVVIIISICLIFFSGCGAEGSKEKQSSVSQRIISFGPVITEELYLLGAGDKIVGNTTYCIRPPEAKNIEKIGSMIKADMEKIISLKPDIVFATTMSDKKQIEKCEKTGIEVIVFSYAKSFSEICEQFLLLGKTVGKEKDAQKIINKAKTDIVTIRKNVDDLPKTKVFIQIGADPLFTVTKDSFINSYIEFAGGENIAYDAETGQYSREEVLKRNPDVIIIVTMGIAGEEEKEIWQKYETISAVKDEKIYIMDSYKVCSPTPVTFVETLREIAGILHPKKEEDVE